MVDLSVPFLIGLLVVALVVSAFCFVSYSGSSIDKYVDQVGSPYSKETDRVAAHYKSDDPRV
jgi:hypothetical protein